MSKAQSKELQQLENKLSVQVKKLHKDAKLPDKKPQDIEDAGWDLYTIERKRIAGHSKYAIRTGIAMAIPEGWYGQIKNRSGVAINTSLMIDAGVIDPGYRGEIKVVLVNMGEYPTDVEVGTKIAQIVFERIPSTEIKEVADLPPSERDTKGFGSTGT